MSINDEPNKKKILVLGLEKSGKTSIVLNFIGKYNISDFFSYNNTKNPNVVKLESDNITFCLWDFNGNEADRNEFLKNFKKYIVNTKEIFFVIDIQDLKRYDLTLTFLQEVIKKLQDLSLKVEFTFFLHKYDRDLFERFPEIKEEKIESLIRKIKQIVPPEEFHEIYKSTIYTVLDKIHIY
ncbi:MAG: ADP-ribosylation factor-like protein [Candidatus Thorarchaeota archaeon]